MTTPEATPRPWASGGDEVYAGSGETYSEICRMYGDAPLADDNAALIVEAVNNFDRLRKIEAAARAVSQLADPDDDFEGAFLDYLVPHDVVTALRAALDEESQP